MAMRRRLMFSTNDSINQLSINIRIYPGYGHHISISVSLFNLVVVVVVMVVMVVVVMVVMVVVVVVLVVSE